MAKEIYKIGKKIYKTWEEYDEAIRQYADEHIDEGEEVEFEFGCSECDKVIKGKKRSKSFQWKKDKKGRTGSEIRMYCKKCFQKLFHPKIKRK